MSLTKTQRKKDKKGAAGKARPDRGDMLDLPYELIGEIYGHVDEDSLRTLALTGTVGRDISRRIVTERHAKIFGASDAEYGHKLRDLALYNLVGTFMTRGVKLPDHMMCVLELEFDGSKLSFTVAPKFFDGKALVSTGLTKKSTTCTLEREAIMDTIKEHQTESESRIINVKLKLYNAVTNEHIPI